MWVKLHGMHKDVRIPELPLLLGSFILTYKLVPCGPLLGGWDCRYFIAFAFCKFHLSLSLSFSPVFFSFPLLHSWFSPSYTLWVAAAVLEVTPMSPSLFVFFSSSFFFLILCLATNIDNLDLMGVIWVGVLDAGERYWTRWHQGSL